MIFEQEIPLWIAILVSAFILAGAFLTLTGTIGLVRLESFYDRIHAPTLGTSWGTGAIVIGSVILFSYLESWAVMHEILIGIFVTVTTPVTFMLLGRAALYRDRSEQKAVALASQSAASSEKTTRGHTP